MNGSILTKAKMVCMKTGDLFYYTSHSTQIKDLMLEESWVVFWSTLFSCPHSKPKKVLRLVQEHMLGVATSILSDLVY